MTPPPLLGLLGAEDPSLRVIEEFRPLHESLEWVLQRGYYERAGASAFTGGEIPFAVTSSGQLSEDAAAILFASLESSGGDREPIRCLELGPGSGLFAKLLLDDLRHRCHERGRDYYDRMVLVLADSSRAMLDAIAANRLLAEHAGRYELVLSDPLRPAQAAAGSERLRAVFLNYVLDNLPASLVRRAETGIEHLCVRTRIARDARLEDYTALSLEQAIELVNAAAESNRQRLAELFPALVIDARYEPVEAAELPEADALDGILPARIGEMIVHGHGAVACLRGLAERLTPGGFLLVNDFAFPTGKPAAADHPPYPVYGGAIAIGLNLAQLERAVGGWPGLSFQAPVADDKHLVSRLIGLGPTDATTACFAERFDPTRRQALRAPREGARTLLEDGRPGAARAALVLAAALAPDDWTLAEETASFLAYIDRDHDGAREVARHGVELNPLATSLWNVLGDCELHARRPQQALDCFTRAIELNPREVRGRYNASYALTAIGEHGGALRMIAEAMALDDGSYRERLLRKQARILDLLARRRDNERKRMRNRIRPVGA